MTRSGRWFPLVMLVVGVFVLSGPSLAADEPLAIDALVACGGQLGQFDPAALAGDEALAVLLLEDAQCPDGQSCCVRSNCDCGQPPYYPACCDATCACVCIAQGTACCPEN